MRFSNEASEIEQERVHLVCLISVNCIFCLSGRGSMGPPSAYAVPSLNKRTRDVGEVNKAILFVLVC